MPQKLPAQLDRECFIPDPAVRFAAIHQEPDALISARTCGGVPGDWYPYINLAPFIRPSAVILRAIAICRF